MNKRVPYAGASAITTRECVRLAQMAGKVGADAQLCAYVIQMRMKCMSISKQ